MIQIIDMFTGKNKEQFEKWLINHKGFRTSEGDMLFKHYSGAQGPGPMGPRRRGRPTSRARGPCPLGPWALGPLGPWARAIGPQNGVYIQYCTWYIVYGPLYIVYCNLYIVYFTLHIYIYIYIYIFII